MMTEEPKKHDTKITEAQNENFSALCMRVCVCVCVCVFIKLHITAQPGPDILVFLCYSNRCVRGRCASSRIGTRATLKGFTWSHVCDVDERWVNEDGSKSSYDDL